MLIPTLYPDFLSQFTSGKIASTSWWWLAILTNEIIESFFSLKLLFANSIIFLTSFTYSSFLLLSSSGSIMYLLT